MLCTNTRGVDFTRDDSCEGVKSSRLAKKDNVGSRLLLQLSNKSSGTRAIIPPVSRIVKSQALANASALGLKLLSKETAHSVGCETVIFTTDAAGIFSSSLKKLSLLFRFGRLYCSNAGSFETAAFNSCGVNPTAETNCVEKRSRLTTSRMFAHNDLPSSVKNWRCALKLDVAIPRSDGILRIIRWTSSESRWSSFWSASSEGFNLSRNL